MEAHFIFLRKDNIIQLEFTEDNYYGEVEDARNMIDTFRILNNGVKHALIVLYKEHNMFSKEAREYISTKEICDNVLVADAIVPVDGKLSVSISPAVITDVDIRARA